jgi:hypothetical protein
MEWVMGCQLNEYLEKNLNNKKKLQALETHWAEMLREIEDAKIGHADLQHGNVLVTDAGELKLIDYDGMWVPALKGKGSHEMGHPDYQSPQRTDKDFDLGVDEFSGNIIQMSIRALSMKPELWKKYNNGDNLLFRRGDYLDPDALLLVVEFDEVGQVALVQVERDLLVAVVEIRDVSQEALGGPAAALALDLVHAGEHAADRPRQAQAVLGRFAVLEIGILETVRRRLYGLLIVVHRGPVRCDGRRHG